MLTQALVAVWFYKLFRSISSTAVGSLAAFGLINGTAILSSAAFLVTALAVALDPGLSAGGNAAATAQLMYELPGPSGVWVPSFSVCGWYRWAIWCWHHAGCPGRSAGS